MSYMISRQEAMRSHRFDDRVLHVGNIARTLV